MAALNDQQVNRCDNDWYRSDADIQNKTIGTDCSSDPNKYQDNSSETDENRADTNSNFDAVINELQLDTNSGGAELDENVADDISPAIQISKTFSLATLDTPSYCNEKPPSIQSNTSPLQSYNLTNLDNENKSADNMNTASCTNNTLHHAYSSTSTQECVNQDDPAKQFLSTYKRKSTISKKPIECHVIDLETFSTSRTCSTIKVETNSCVKTCGYTSVKPYSGTPSDHNTYSTQTQTIFLTDDEHGVDMVYSDANQDQQESFIEDRPYFVEDTNKLPHDVSLSDPNYDVGISSFYLHDVGGGSFGYVCNLDQMATETTENENTSDLVIDLNERMPGDSGIFEVSLTGKNTLSNFADHQLVMPSIREHAKRTCSPKNREATRDSVSSDGGHKERLSFLHDKQSEESPRMYQKNMAYNVPHRVKRDIFYDGMKTLRDPYVTDEYSYMYHQNYNSPFLCNRAFPYSTWDSTCSQKNSYNPMFTGLVDESAQGAWCSESFADFFESRNPQDVSQYSQLSTIKDEEETDDADETGFMHETPDLSSNHLGQRPDHLPGYFFTDNPDVSRFTSATLTPPPSEASTPDPLSNLYGDMSTHQWGSSVSTCPLPDYVSHETTSTVSPFQQQHQHQPYTSLKTDYLDSNFLNQGSQRGITRSFPSMADAIYSSYSCSPSKYISNETATRKIDTNTKRRGKPRKSQIQSDKISTSTPKCPNANRDKPELTGNKITHQGSDIQTKVKPQPRTTKTTAIDRIPRHNEPLKQHAIDVMTKWYEENIHNPYPTKAQKTAMAQEGQISENQVKSWFANKRNRSHNTKPKVHKRAMEEKLKELFKDLKNSNPTTPTDNSHIIQQLSGIIQHCHMKLD